MSQQTTNNQPDEKEKYESWESDAVVATEDNPVREPESITEELLPTEDGFTTRSEAEKTQAEREKEPEKKEKKAEKKDDTDDDGGGEEDEEKKPRRKNKTARQRINELTAKMREEQRQRLALEAKLRDQEKAADPKTPEPKLDDFDEMDEFLEARDKWRDEQASNTPTQDVPPEAQALATAYQEMVTSGREGHEDFDEVALGEHVVMGQALATAVIQRADGADIAYYLGKHPERAEKMNAKVEQAIARYPEGDPRRGAIAEFVAAQELTQIEALLDGPDETTDEHTLETHDEKPSQTAPSSPKQKRVSSAPEPIKPLSTSGTDGPQKDPDEMNMSEYAAYRSAQMRRRR